MALWFTLGINGDGAISLVELTTKRIIKQNADLIDLNRIRKKYEKRFTNNKRPRI